MVLFYLSKHVAYISPTLFPISINCQSCSIEMPSIIFTIMRMQHLIEMKHKPTRHLILYSALSISLVIIGVASFLFIGLTMVGIGLVAAGLFVFVSNIALYFSIAEKSQQDYTIFIINLLVALPIICFLLFFTYKLFTEGIGF